MIAGARVQEPTGEARDEILWPALGCPQRLSASGELVVITAPAFSRGATARLRPATGGGTVELETVDAGLTPIGLAAGPGPWPRWIARRHPTVARLRFRTTGAAPAGGSATLFDLELTCDGRTLVKPAAVYTAGPRLRLFAATDVHVARRWQHLREAAVRDLPARAERTLRSVEAIGSFDPADALAAECLLHSLVDANANFARFIRLANEGWRRGEVDAVLLCGDLVDYKFSQVRAHSDGSFAASEWSLFIDILLGRWPGGERLLVPAFTALGNHDYRLYPYPIQIYGIRHSGVADELSEELVRRSGHWRRLKYRLADLDAVRVDTGARHSLEFYFRHVNPFENYAVDLGAARLVVLDTGPDFYCDPRNLMSRRWRSFLSAALRGEGGVRSTGFTEQQVAFLRSALAETSDAAPVVLVSHAPPINPLHLPDTVLGSVPLGISVPPPTPRRRGPIRRALHFESTLRSRRLDAGAAFHGQLPLLEALLAAPAPLVVLSGHSHWQLELALDRSSGAVVADRYTDRNDPREITQHQILMLQTPALGHINRDDVRNGRPSFRSLAIDRGEFSELQCRQLDQPPFAHGVDEWTSAGGAGDEIVSLSFQRDHPAPAQPRWLRVVCWLRGDLRAIGPQRLAAMAVTHEPAGAVLLVTDRRELHAGGYLSFVSHGPQPFRLRIERRPPALAIAFLFEEFVRSGDVFRSTGLRLHHRRLE